MLRALMILGLLASTPFLFARDTDRSGLLYGTVTMSSGTEYRGVLRWGSEEAYWDDIFNSSKTELEFQMSLPETYEDGKQVEHLQKEYATVKARVEDAYRKWEEAQLELEELANTAT